MRRYAFQTTTPTSPDRLYRAIADVARWREWDPDIEATEIAGPAVAGQTFTLKPKGGPRVSLRILEALAPSRFVDEARLPLAKMRTVHQFTPTQDGAKVEIVIEIEGWLAFLWDRVIARPQAAGAAEQTKRLAAYAAALP